jgi:hypothetical protein
MKDSTIASCEAQRDAICAKTGETIKAGEPCWWVKAVGVFKEEPSPEDINLVLRNGAIDGMLDALGEGSSSGGPSKHLIKGDLV